MIQGNSNLVLLCHEHLFRKCPEQCNITTVSSLRTSNLKQSLVRKQVNVPDINVKFLRQLIVSDGTMFNSKKLIKREDKFKWVETALHYQQIFPITTFTGIPKGMSPIFDYKAIKVTDTFWSFLCLAKFNRKPVQNQYTLHNSLASNLFPLSMAQGSLIKLQSGQSLSWSIVEL